MTRAGFSLTEAVVAVFILAVAGVAIMTTSQGETAGVAKTEERYIAEILLGELEGALSGNPLEYYADRGFGPPPAAGAPAGLDPALETLLEDHPAITGPLPPLGRDPTPVGEALRATMARMRVTRGVYLETMEAGGVTAGVVTFRVGYEARPGEPRAIESRRVVYPVSQAP